MTSKQADIYHELAAKHGWPKSKYLPLIFKRMVTPEQASILLQFVATPDEIAAKLGMDKKKVDSQIQELFEKGLAFPTRKGWRLNRMMDSLHDMALTNKKYLDSYGGTEYIDLWGAFERLEWWPELVANAKSAGITLSRILPAWEAIKDNPERLPEEDAREIYKAAESIVLLPCTCRLESYHRECGSPLEICIALNRSAEHNLKRGIGKKITVDEALELEKVARKHNLITQVPNTRAVEMVVCHCHTCCCMAFLAFGQCATIYDAFAKSRYLATVADPEKCTACQKCIETCLFDAIEMKKYPGMTRWKATVNADKCMGCGNCVVQCPKEGTMVLQIVRPPEHIPGEYLDPYAYGNVHK